MTKPPVRHSPAEKKTDNQAKYSLDMILDTISEPFFALDKEWIFTYVNAQAERTLEMTRDELIGQNIWKKFPHAVGSDFDSNYREAMKTGTTVTFESFYAPMDTWFQVRAAAFQDGLLVSFTDNNDQHHNQAKISSSEERFRTLIQKSSDAVQLASPDGRLLYSSDSVQSVLGYTPDELQGQVLTPFIHPDDRARFERVFSDIMKQSGNHAKIEYRVRHKNGRYIWLDVTMANHLDNPNIGALVGNFRDITQRKKQEAALQKSEQRYREIASRISRQSYLTKVITDNATLGLLLMNDRQQCTFMNPAASDITGFTFEEIQEMNKPLHDIIHHTRPDGSNYPMSECPIDSALPERNQTQGEDIFVHKSGSFYPVAFTASPIIEDGIPTGTVIEIRDMSEEKRSQSRKKELEQLTKALARQRNKLIELNKAKDEFISLASHQLRTPATGVKQYVNMVIDGFAGDLTEGQAAMLRTANESNERQLKIIDDLLKVARADAGKIRPVFAECDLTTMIAAVIDEHRSIFQSRSQTVVYQPGEAAVSAMVDARLIRMVFENIIDNASKYTPEGKKICIGTNQASGHVTIAIQDEGVGIARKDMHMLFNKFSRIDNPLSAKVGGTGLGLYWSKTIIELHNGSIKVASTHNKGTTFTIRLPQTQQGQPAISGQ